jgi:hypothetical protein
MLCQEVFRFRNFMILKGETWQNDLDWHAQASSHGIWKSKSLCALRLQTRSKGLLADLVHNKSTKPERIANIKGNVNQ